MSIYDKIDKFSRYPAYHQSLSEASKGTLINQGGPMSSTEASAFEQHPDFQGFMNNCRYLSFKTTYSFCYNIVSTFFKFHASQQNI